MQRRLIAGIVITGLASLLVIFALYIKSDKNPQYRHASFNRNIISDYLEPRDTIDLLHNSYYLTGSTSSRLYLGNTTVPFSLLAIDTETGQYHEVKIDTKYVPEAKFRSFTVVVDSPFFYMADGTMPIILRGEIKGWQPTRPIFDSVYFVDFQPVDSTMYVVKSLSSTSGEHVLGKVSVETPNVQLFTTLLEKQIDGLFCTDGEILYDKSMKQLVYVYRYRNEFFVMNKQLALAYRGNTIDSISKAKIQVASISSDNSHTMSAPALLVNKHSQVWQGFLYIHSNIMARNESRAVFDSAAIIDVYNLTDGKYAFSFYIPNYGAVSIRNFIVRNDKLICLYEYDVVIYEMNGLRKDKEILHVRSG